MTIERLSFKDGYPIDLKGDISEQLAKVTEEYEDKFQVLPEGDYQLTPDWWKGAQHHHITVLENGNGLYRMVPRVEDAGTEAENESFKKGGKLVQIPQEHRSPGLIGLTRDLKGTALYEIVRFTPGPSPKAPHNGEISG